MWRNEQSTDMRILIESLEESSRWDQFSDEELNAATFKMTGSESDFLDQVRAWDRRVDFEGEGQTARFDFKRDNNQRHVAYFKGSDNIAGILSHKGSGIILVHGSYSNNERDKVEDQRELLGAIVKSPKGFDVFYNQPGYNGTNSQLDAALDTLIVSAFG